MVDGLWGGYREVGAVEASSDELDATGGPYVSTRLSAARLVGGEHGGDRE
jgi:hypothetical protein